MYWLKLSVHDLTARKVPSRNGKVAKWKSWLARKNSEADLRFAKKYVDVPVDLGQDESKVDFGGYVDDSISNKIKTL